MLLGAAEPGHICLRTAILAIPDSPSLYVQLGKHEQLYAQVAIYRACPVRLSTASSFTDHTRILTLKLSKLLLDIDLTLRLLVDAV